MRWVRFVDGETSRYGFINESDIVEVAGDPFAGWTETGATRRLSDATLDVPVMPRTFYCVGLNYDEHIREQAEKRGETPNLPTRPEVGYRAQNALIPHGGKVVIPSDATEKVHYEGELVVVIGRKARHVCEAEALSCVLGYTVGNDVSERTWQKSDRTFWRSKNCDTFKPMGPWIETEADLDSMRTTVSLNGEPRTEFQTNKMLFGVETFIATMSRYLTLWPGDVIWMGTDGVSPDLKPGDHVDIEITGIGTLSNTFVAEEPVA